MAVSSKIFKKGEKEVVYVFIEGKLGYSNVVLEDSTYGGYKADLIITEDDIEAINAIITENKEKLIDRAVKEGAKLEKINKAPFQLNVRTLEMDGETYTSIRANSKFQPSLTVGENKYSSKLDNLAKTKKYGYIKRLSPATLMVELYPYASFGGGVATRLVNVNVPNNDCTGLRE